MTTDTLTAELLDEVTAQQRTAQDDQAAAIAELAEVTHRLADAAADGLKPTDDELDLLAVADDNVKRAALRVLGLARRRQRLEAEQRGSTTAPTPGDPRGIVRVRIAGKAGRHACNQPSTGRALEGGQVLDVTAGDALALAELGYAELVGDRPEWWPQRIPATGQALAAAR